MAVVLCYNLRISPQFHFLTLPWISDVLKAIFTPFSRGLFERKKSPSPDKTPRRIIASFRRGTERMSANSSHSNSRANCNVFFSPRLSVAPTVQAFSSWIISACAYREMSSNSTPVVSKVVVAFLLLFAASCFVKTFAICVVYAIQSFSWAHELYALQCEFTTSVCRPQKLRQHHATVHMGPSLKLLKSTCRMTSKTWILMQVSDQLFKLPVHAVCSGDLCVFTKL